MTPTHAIPASGWRGRWRSARPPGAARRPAWPLPDFLPPRQRPPLLAWALCAVGLACLALAAADAWQQHRALQETAAVQARWQGELRRLAEAATPAPSREASTTEPSARARTEAARVAHRLSHRWDQVLQPIEQAHLTGTQWLRLAHDVDSGALQIEGQVPLREDALRLAARLGAAPGWDAVLVQRVEALPDGSPAVRFQLAAQLLLAEPVTGAAR